MTATEPGRNKLIDLLRGVSIFLVLIRHFQIAYHLDESLWVSIFPRALWRPILANGNYGVTIFFVISGFLITSTSLKRFGSLRRINLPSFYSYRFARIAPNISLMVGIVVILAVCGVRIFMNAPNKVSLWMTVISIGTFTHNILMQKYGYFNYCLNVLWSLSVEEIFYFSFPVLCVLLRKDIFIVAVLCAFILIGPIHRSHHTKDEIIALYDYLSCFDAIAIGCLVAILRSRIRLNITWSRVLLTFGICLTVIVYFYGGIMSNVIYGVSLIALGTGAILLSINQETESSSILKSKTFRPVEWMGEKSYELYLFHVIVLAIMRILVQGDRLASSTKAVWFLCYLVVSCLVAGTISRFFSEPLNGYLRVRAATFFTSIRNIPRIKPQALDRSLFPEDGAR